MWAWGTFTVEVCTPQNFKPLLIPLTTFHFHLILMGLQFLDHPITQFGQLSAQSMNFHLLSVESICDFAKVNTAKQIVKFRKTHEILLCKPNDILCKFFCYVHDESIILIKMPVLENV